MKKLLFLFIFVAISCNAQKDVSYSPEDVKICKSKFKFSIDHKLETKPINEVMIAIGKTFLGTKYVANTLEKGDTEHLVIHLSGLDCYTFFEATLTLSRCVKESKTTFENFEKELTKIRYRNGKINGYPSRLHYASDWLYDNARRGIVKDMTKEIGGVPFHKKINFMTTHVKFYKQLLAHPEFVDSMKKVEEDMNRRNYYYIPQDSIAKVESKIESGDILLLTSNIPGLDIAHTGIAIRLNDGRIHFLHAPLVGKKVQITKEPLADHIKKVKKETGIMVVKPLEP